MRLIDADLLKPKIKLKNAKDSDLIQLHETLIKWIDCQPTVEQWIPVSERLPEEDEIVLLTICANDSFYGFNENFVKVMCGSYSPSEDKRDWIVNDVRYYIDNVVAWKPLPEPYKEEE